MNSNRFKKWALLLAAVLLLIQFIRLPRNSGSATGDQDLSKVVQVPAEINTMLETSCYDCHSNKTVYPWYANIQPLGWWLQYHVNEGKEELNFSEFASYDLKRQAHKMEEIAEMVEEGEMPMSAYTLIHKNAVLTEAQKTSLIAWAKENHTTLKASQSATPGASEASEKHEEHQD